MYFGSKEIRVFGSFRPFFKIFEIFEKFCIIKIFRRLGQTVFYYNRFTYIIIFDQLSNTSSRFLLSTEQSLSAEKTDALEDIMHIEDIPVHYCN